MMRLVPRRLAAASLLTLGLAGCYHYHLTVPQPNPVSLPQSRVIRSYFWGLVNRPQAARAANCDNSNAIDQVRITNRYTLVTLLTLGIYAPVEVTWMCSKKPEPTDTIGGGMGEGGDAPAL